MPSKNGSKPATQADLETVRAELGKKIEVVRVELDKKIGDSTKRLAIEIGKTNERMEAMEGRLSAKMDTRFNQVLTAIDAFAKQSESDHGAVAIHGHVLTEVQVGLKDHEGRLKTLESARP